MKDLETVEQLLNGLKDFSETTIRATHSIYYSTRKKQWVVNLTNKGKTFYADDILGAVEAAYVWIKFNRNLNKRGIYSL